jgi:hypothetical protein
VIDPARLSYKPGWSFKIGGPGNRFLCVFADTIDSQRRSCRRLTQHMFEIPSGGFADDRELARWVFEHLLLAELHEAGEFFELDGHAPFFPNHQDEGSPYERVERWEPT